MRTMNKIVALSLVLAMAFSMMASAASFKDQATINEDLIDEINMMLALNVYSEQGTGAGYFEPNGTITRAQAAKIIYVLKNKGVDNGATGWTGLNIFTDVEAGAWYEGYVNYCASTGIIAGVGDNKFAPNGTLTGVELAKMLLVVIGYKADLEGYTGANWAANILADAEAAGFFVDYELAVRGVVTREWAAKMIVNAINAIKVKYSEGEAVEMYDVWNNAITYANQDLGLKSEVGYATGTAKFWLNENVGAPVTKGTDGKISKVGEFEINYDIPAEMLGQEVKVLYKETDNVDGLTSGDKIYGVTATGKSKVYEVNFADITVDGNNFKFAGYNNGELKAIPTATIYNNFFTFDKTNTKDMFVAHAQKTPYEAKMIDKNGDGVIDYVFTAIPVIGKATTVNAAKYDLVVTGNRPIDTNETKAEFEKINFVDTIAKNDIVAVIDDYATGKAIVNVEKVDSIVGKITKWNSNGSYVIGDTTYKTASTFFGNNAPSGLTSADATFYVVDNYVVATSAITDKNDQTNIVLLLAKNPGSGVFAAKQVQVMDAEGTKTIYDYKEITSNIPTGYVAFGEAMTTGTAYEAVVADGTIYFKSLNTTNNGVDTATGNNIVFAGATSKLSYSTTSKKFTVTAGDAAVVENASGSISFSNIAGEKLAADGAYFFVNKAGTWKVLKASEIVDVIENATLTQFALAKSGVPTIKYGVMTLAEGAEWPTNTSSSAVYGILASSYTSYKNADNVTVHDVVITLVDGTTKTLTVATEPTSAELKKLVTFTEDTKGIATIDAAGLTNGTLKSFSGNNLYMTVSGNDQFMTLADNAKVYFVDQNAANTSIAMAEGTDLVVAAEGVTGNVWYKLDNNKIVTIFVEVDGAQVTLVK